VNGKTEVVLKERERIENFEDCLDRFCVKYSVSKSEVLKAISKMLNANK